MFNIGLFSTNSHKLTETTTKEEIKRMMEDCFKLKETTHENMMKECIDFIQLTHEQMADTEIVAESEDYIYQLCHIPTDSSMMQKNKEKDDENDDREFNSLASYLTRSEVYGNAVLIRSKIKEDRTCDCDSFNDDDVVNEIWKTVNHIGIKIGTDDNISEFRYTDPIKTIPNTYRAFEFYLLGYNMYMYVDCAFEGKPINKLASRLTGEYSVVGDVYVILNYNKGYGDLTREDMDKLNKISWIPQKERDLTQEESKEDKIDGRLVVKNRFTVIKDRLKQKSENMYSSWDKFYDSLSDKTPVNVKAYKISAKGE